MPGYKNICFIDTTNFKYDLNDKYSPKLRGGEGALINLSESLASLGYKIFVLNNCRKTIKRKNLTWSPINKISFLDLKYDVVISNGNFKNLGVIKAKKKFLLLHVPINFEKFLRKKYFIPFFKNKPRVIGLGDYHEEKISKIIKIYGFNKIRWAVDEIFFKSKITNNKSKIAIFNSRHERNLDILVYIWKNYIYYKNKSLKLLVTGPSLVSYRSHNIFSRKYINQKKIFSDLKKSRVMLIPGHKSETFCLAAQEANEMCVPIVTLGIGCLKERVEHNFTGFIANTYEEFAKYTLQLFEDDKLWMYFRDNLKKKRGRWKWINTAIQIKKIIQQ